MHKVRLVKQHEISILVQLDKLVSLTPWSIENYISSFDNSNHQIYVIEFANQIIGAIVIAMASDEGEILQLWIKKEFHSKGYGKSLLRHIIEIFKKKLVADVFLEVRNDNLAAIKLYESLGFKAVGIRKDYYKVDGWKFDAILMLKKIDSCII